jgi:hypothetical protein
VRDGVFLVGRQRRRSWNWLARSLGMRVGLHCMCIGDCGTVNKLTYCYCPKKKYLFWLNGPLGRGLLNCAMNPALFSLLTLASVKNDSDFLNGVQFFWKCFTPWALKVWNNSASLSTTMCPRLLLHSYSQPLYIWAPCDGRPAATCL